MLPADLERFALHFDLFRRDEGRDRGGRRSVWLTYRRKLAPEQR
jgi:hypothetical protein